MAVEKRLEEFKKAIDKTKKTHSVTATDGNIFTGDKEGYVLRKPTVSPTTSASTKSSSSSPSTTSDDEDFEVVPVSSQTPPEKNTIDDATIVKAFHNLWANFNSANTWIGKGSLAASSKKRSQLFTDLDNAFSALFNPSYPKNNETFYTLVESFQKLVASFINELSTYTVIPEVYKNEGRNFLNSLQFILQSVINTKTINKLMGELDIQLENSQLSYNDKVELIVETQAKIAGLMGENQYPSGAFTSLCEGRPFFQHVAEKAHHIFEEKNQTEINITKEIQGRIKKITPSNNESVDKTREESETKDNVLLSSTSTTPSPEASNKETNIASETGIPATSNTEVAPPDSREIADILNVDKNVEEPESLEISEKVQETTSEKQEQTERSENVQETTSGKQEQTETSESSPITTPEEPENPEIPESVQTTNVEEKKQTEIQEKDKIPASIQQTAPVEEPVTPTIPKTVQPETNVKESVKPETSFFSLSNLINFLGNSRQSEKKEPTPETQPEKNKSEDTFSSFGDIMNRFSSETNILSKKIVDTASSILESEKDQKERLEREKVRDQFHQHVIQEYKEDKPSSPNESENSNQITEDLIQITEKASSKEVTPNIHVRDPYAYNILPSDDVVLFIEAAKPPENQTIETVNAEAPIDIKKVDVEAKIKPAEIFTNETKKEDPLDTSNDIDNTNLSTATSEPTKTDTTEAQEEETDTSIFKILASVALIVALTVVGITIGLVVGGIPGAIAGGFVGAFTANAILIPILLSTNSVDKESMEEDQEKGRAPLTTNDELTRSLKQKNTPQDSIQADIAQTSSDTKKVAIPGENEKTDTTTPKIF